MVVEAGELSDLLVVSGEIERGVDEVKGELAEIRAVQRNAITQRVHVECLQTVQVQLETRDAFHSFAVMRRCPF